MPLSDPAQADRDPKLPVGEPRLVRVRHRAGVAQGGALGGVLGREAGTYQQGTGAGELADVHRVSGDG